MQVIKPVTKDKEGRHKNQNKADTTRKQKCLVKDCLSRKRSRNISSTKCASISRNNFRRQDNILAKVVRIFVGNQFVFWQVTFSTDTQRLQGGGAH